jgi:predicted membrane-bound spermidine synthase
MQRLNVFLGHPNYGLSVVLFTLLLASSIGSFLTRKVDPVRLPAASLLALGALLLVLALFGAATPPVIRHFQASATPLRVVVAGGILFPLGIFMGMPFPLGMKLASARSAALTPWLWGINGATSVLASAAAMVIALGSSITASFWTGFGCYAAASLMYAFALRPQPAESSGDSSPA